MDKPESKETDRKWRYSLWTGVMYGPIPVGLIIVSILTIVVVIYTITR